MVKCKSEKGPERQKRREDYGKEKDKQTSRFHGNGFPGSGIYGGLQAEKRRDTGGACEACGN